MSLHDAFVGLTLVLAAGMATAVVLTRRMRVQAILMSVFGLVQTLVFVVLQAPDLALAQLAVGSAAVPILFVLVINRLSARKP